MPWICTPDFSDAGNDQGWTSRVWASAEVFGQPVPLKVNRWRLDAGARAHSIPLGGTEAFAYVIAGSGTAQASPPGAGPERFGLDAESVLWLAACDSLAAEAGPAGLDLMVAHSTGGGAVTALRVLMSRTVRRNTRQRTASSMNFERSPFFMPWAPKKVRRVRSVSFETLMFQRTAFSI